MPDHGGLLALAHEQACEAELASELDAILATSAMLDVAALRAQFARHRSELPGCRRRVAGFGHVRRAARRRLPRSGGISPDLRVEIAVMSTALRDSMRVGGGPGSVN